MILPVDYSICSQTVTVYRAAPDGVIRTELPGCFLLWQEEMSYGQLGRQQVRKFQLIQPGECQQVFPGDRVMEGIGPEITKAEWPRFVPELVEGLGEVAYAKVYRWQGQYCHTEAGRK